MNDKPEQLNGMRNEVPPELESIVGKALEKNPRDRYQSVDEILMDLKKVNKMRESVIESNQQINGIPQKSKRIPAMLIYGLGGIVFIVLLAIIGLQITDDNSSSAVNKKSIAVMPFKNMSSDVANDYFSEGITEDIIAQLSNIKELKVIARSSVERFKDSGLASNEIGAQLKVASILEGSVRRGGDRVRIVSRLIDVENEENIWAETYDRELKDIFQIQSEVSQRIAEALQAKLSPIEQKRLEKKPTDNMDAYNLYLQGRFHWRKRKADELLKAAADFEQAVSIDSRFALAYVGLADCYALFPYYGVRELPRETAFEKAEKMARQALELEPDLAAAHTSLGNVLKEGKWDWQAAEEEFKKAIVLNPKDANAHQWYSELLLILNRDVEALEMAQTAYNLEPYAQVISNNLGRTLLFMGQYERSVQHLLKTIELDPTFIAGHNNLGWAYIFSTQLEKAKNEFRQWSELSKIEALFVEVLMDSKNVTALQQMEQILETEKNRTIRYSNISQAPLVYAMLNDKQKTIEWLTILYERRSPAFIYHLGHPALQKYNDEAEFRKLYNQIGLN